MPNAFKALSYIRPPGSVHITDGTFAPSNSESPNNTKQVDDPVYEITIYSKGIRKVLVASGFHNQDSRHGQIEDMIGAAESFNMYRLTPEEQTLPEYTSVQAESYGHLMIKDLGQDYCNSALADELG